MRAAERTLSRSLGPAPRLGKRASAMLSASVMESATSGRSRRTMGLTAAAHSSARSERCSKSRRVVRSSLSTAEDSSAHHPGSAHLERPTPGARATRLLDLCPRVTHHVAAPLVNPETPEPLRPERAASPANQDSRPHRYVPEDSRRW